MTDSPELRRLLLRLSYDYQIQSALGVGCAALHDAVQRLATLLLKSADRLEMDRIELTQQDIGEFLGMQRTTVNAAARALKEMGAIRYSRGSIQLIDRPALMARACECYRSGKAGRMLHAA